MRVFKDVERFESAHSLPFLPDGHKCKNMHGHSYFVSVAVQCSDEEVDAGGGFAVDYATVSAAWKPIHADLDHHCLDDIIKPSSTCENLARYIWKRMKPALPNLCRVIVRETPTAGVEYEGPATETTIRG